MVDLPAILCHPQPVVPAPSSVAAAEVNLELRGLGPQRNLVLLDGRLPSPSYGGWHGRHRISCLPGIVGGVDIITGGASAVYGSDAVSGVVNFKIQKRPSDGLDVTTSYGTTWTALAAGSQFDVNGVGGFCRPTMAQGQHDVRGRIYPAATT